ncbi:MAG TPA: ectoine/hydroxyectoine ABC transporter permease subunit EhuD [Acidimicrobiia bacterium]
MSTTRFGPTMEQVEFQPHKRWYQRPEVLIPVLIVTAIYALLIFGVKETNVFRTRMTGAGDFDSMYFWHLLPLMVQGLLVTVKATVLAFTFAAVFGFLLALGRRSSTRWISWPTAAFIEFIRSTPLLVQLFFLLGLVRASETINLEPIWVLTIGLGLHYATYCSEAYRAGINSVPDGQWEAAIALNLKPSTNWLRVIIPQAVPNVLPSLGNYLVAGFKDAPLGFSVGVLGVLAFASQVRAADFRPVEPYIMAGVGFLLVSIPAAWIVRRLERRVSYERQ